MVIPSMRFIDNRGTIPQVLKASSVNPFFEPPVSRGMHPIIGTLSVPPGGDNDARSFLSPAPSTATASAPCLPPLGRPYPSPRLNLNRSQKISFIHCARRVSRGARERGKVAERGKRRREEERNGRRANRVRTGLPVHPAPVSVSYPTIIPATLVWLVRLWQSETRRGTCLLRYRLSSLYFLRVRWSRDLRGTGARKKPDPVCFWDRSAALYFTVGG